MPINWFTFGGSTFLLWGAINTWFAITRYGVGEGMFMWFCNMSLLGTGYGLLKKDRSLIIGFLAMASFTQVFWLVDNTWRVFTGKNLLGIAEFMYQPGFPMDEFIVSHYHFFLIPAGILALFFLKPEKESRFVPYIIVGNVLIFGASYFFPVRQNVNCIHNPCFIGMPAWHGPLYSFIFALVILLGNLAVASGIENLTRGVRFKKATQHLAVKAFAVLSLFCIGLTAYDAHYKKSLPSLTCGEPYEDKEIKVSCKYTSEYEPNVMLFYYTIENKMKQPKICSSTLEVNGKKEVLDKALYLLPQKKYDVPAHLRYPRTNTKVRVLASCVE